MELPNYPVITRIRSIKDHARLAIEFLKITQVEYECVHGEDDEFGKQQIEKAQKMIDELEQFWGLND